MQTLVLTRYVSKDEVGVEKMVLRFCFLDLKIKQKTYEFLVFMVFGYHFFHINFALKPYGYYFFIIIIFSIYTNLHSFYRLPPNFTSVIS